MHELDGFDDAPELLVREPREGGIFDSGVRVNIFTFF
jgi:hypothetical protein